MILADATPSIPLTQTLFVLGGLIGLIGCAVLVLALVEKIQAVFGRKPPIESLFALRAETEARFKELARDMGERFDIMSAQRQHSNDELHGRITDLANDVSFIRGKIEKL